MPDKTITLTKKEKFRVHDKDGKRRNYLMYFLNGELLMKQKYPFEATSERGFDIRVHVKNEYLLNGRIYQTRFNVDTRETRNVSFPASKTLLKKFEVPKEMNIPITKEVKKHEIQLYNADPDCEHDIISLWSGVKCRKCPGWYCA